MAADSEITGNCIALTEPSTSIGGQLKFDAIRDGNFSSVSNEMTANYEKVKGVRRFSRYLMHCQTFWLPQILTQRRCDQKRRKN